jgi:hypothetical protein
MSAITYDLTSSRKERKMTMMAKCIIAESCDFGFINKHEIQHPIGFAICVQIWKFKMPTFEPLCNSNVRRKDLMET